jgi:hypothetical protein
MEPCSWRGGKRSTPSEIDAPNVRFTTNPTWLYRRRSRGSPGATAPVGTGGATFADSTGLGAWACARWRATDHAGTDAEAIGTSTLGVGAMGAESAACVVVPSSEDGSTGARWGSVRPNRVPTQAIPKRTTRVLTPTKAGTLRERACTGKTAGETDGDGRAASARASPRRAADPNRSVREKAIARLSGAEIERVRAGSRSSRRRTGVVAARANRSCGVAPSWASSPVANLRSVAPMAQTSVCSSTRSQRPCACSGDMNPTVPRTESTLVRPSSVGSDSQPRPKSSTFSSPLRVRKRFWGFMSR